MIRDLAYVFPPFYLVLGYIFYSCSPRTVARARQHECPHNLGVLRIVPRPWSLILPMATPYQQALPQEQEQPLGEHHAS